MLLLNGIAMSMSSWDPVVERLALRFRVLRCDLRGQLLSPGEPPGDVLDQAREVVALLDHLEVERIHLVGTSFGGVVAALVAARWPERARSLVSVASADGFDGTMAVEVERWRQACLEVMASGDSRTLSDAFDEAVYSPAYLEEHAVERAERRRLLGLLPRAWYEGLAGLLASAPSVDLAAHLGAISCPALVVAAEHDGFIPRARTRALADGIPCARFEVMAGAGHAVVVEQPDAVTELVVGFVGSAPAQARS